MKLARHKKDDTVWLRLYEVLRVVKSIETERMMGAGGQGRGWRAAIAPGDRAAI